MKTDKKLFLYSGLFFLFVAILIRGTGAPILIFWILFGLAILLKAVFLVLTLRTKGFKPGLWLYFVLTGVTLILISLLFKTIYPVPLLRNMLFYTAISLKVVGLGLMIFQRSRSTDRADQSHDL